MLRYVGSGDYVQGVPARDLSDDDLADLARTGLSQEALLATGLYVPAETADTAPGEEA